MPESRPTRRVGWGCARANPWTSKSAPWGSTADEILLLRARHKGAFQNRPGRELWRE